MQSPSTRQNPIRDRLANREIPEIIQGVTPSVHQATGDGLLACGRDLHVVRAGLLEEIVTGATPSAARVFKDPPVVNWKVASKPIPIYMNTVGV